MRFLQFLFPWWGAPGVHYLPEILTSDATLIQPGAYQASMIQPTDYAAIMIQPGSYDAVEVQ